MEHLQIENSEMDPKPPVPAVPAECGSPKPEQALGEGNPPPVAGEAVSPPVAEDAGVLPATGEVEVEQEPPPPFPANLMKEALNKIFPEWQKLMEEGPPHVSMESLNITFRKLLADIGGPDPSFVSFGGYWMLQFLELVHRLLDDFIVDPASGASRRGHHLEKHVDVSNLDLYNRTRKNSDPEQRGKDNFDTNIASKFWDRKTAQLAILLLLCLNCHKITKAFDDYEKARNIALELKRKYQEVLDGTKNIPKPDAETRIKHSKMSKWLIKKIQQQNKLLLRNTRAEDTFSCEFAECSLGFGYGTSPDDMTFRTTFSKAKAILQIYGGKASIVTCFPAGDHADDQEQLPTTDLELEHVGHKNIGLLILPMGSGDQRIWNTLEKINRDENSSCRMGWNVIMKAAEPYIQEAAEKPFIPTLEQKEAKQDAIVIVKNMATGSFNSGHERLQEYVSKNVHAMNCGLNDPEKDIPYDKIKIADDDAKMEEYNENEEPAPSKKGAQQKRKGSGSGKKASKETVEGSKRICIADIRVRTWCPPEQNDFYPTALFETDPGTPMTYSFTRKSGNYFHTADGYILPTDEATNVSDSIEEEPVFEGCSLPPVAARASPSIYMARNETARFHPAPDSQSDNSQDSYQ